MESNKVNEKSIKSCIYKAFTFCIFNSVVVLVLRKLRHFSAFLKHKLRKERELKRSKKQKNKERKRSVKEIKGTKRSGERIYALHKNYLLKTYFFYIR